MHVIQAHRKRIAELAEAFGTLMDSERTLLELRSKSWGLQVLGDASRESDLRSIHTEIDDMSLEVERLREVLTTPHATPKPVQHPEDTLASQ